MTFKEHKAELSKFLSFITYMVVDPATTDDTYKGETTLKEKKCDKLHRTSNGK